MKQDIKRRQWQKPLSFVSHFLSKIGLFKSKKHPAETAGCCGIRQRPTLPGRLQPSTIGAERLNFCVRDGNRWIPFAIVTGMLLKGSTFFRALRASLSIRASYPENCTTFHSNISQPALISVLSPFGSSPRPISIIKLHPLLNFHR